MKAAHLLVMGAIISGGVAGVWYRMGVADPQPAAVVGSAAKASPSSREPSSRMTSQSSPGGQGRERLRAFLADESAGPLTPETYEQVRSILGDAVDWNRKELIAAAEEMMAGDLSAPRPAYLFGGLLNLLSTKDGAGALALYDRARETAGFNRDGQFHVHEMVLNLADHDPVQAEEWVRDRQDQLTEEVAAVLLEKVRGKGAR